MHFEPIGTIDGTLLHLMLAMPVLATLLSRLLGMRLAMLGMAICGLAYFIRTESLGGMVWSGVLLLIAAAQVIRMLLGDIRASFQPQEKSLLAMFDGLNRGHARHLIDQGLWLNGKVGDVLTQEGQAVPNLYFLESGSALVSIAGKIVAHCRPANFIGEVTALAGTPATGTVTLDQPSRLWCVPAEKLRAYVETHDGVRAALERAFRQALTEKLVAANATIAELGGDPGKMA